MHNKNKLSFAYPIAMLAVAALTLFAVSQLKTLAIQKKSNGKIMTDIRLMTLDPGHFHAARV